MTVSLSMLENGEKIRRLSQEKREFLKRGCWNEHFELLDRLPTFEELRKRGKVEFDVSGPAVRIGSSELLTLEEHEILNQIVRLLRPWRKGPIELFGLRIDAEWQSDLKFARIAPYLEAAGGKRVADIGCGNGYYMMRALQYNPECIVGFEPYEQFYFAFHLMQRFVQDSRLVFELLGVENVSLFSDFFDVVLCMGIIYHQKSPIDMLRDIHISMAVGAMLILESQGIPGENPLALVPRDRYAQMRNVHFVPTASCLENWTYRAGFRDVEIFSAEKLTTLEQRKTPLGSTLSLEDYLDDSGEKTVEGYPAPYRIALRAYKR